MAYNLPLKGLSDPIIQDKTTNNMLIYPYMLDFSWRILLLVDGG